METLWKIYSQTKELRCTAGSEPGVLEGLREDDVFGVSEQTKETRFKVMQGQIMHGFCIVSLYFKSHRSHWRVLIRAVTSSALYF